MHCIICIIFYTLYSIHCMLCIVFYALCPLHCILCIVFHSLYSMNCIICIVFYVSYSSYFTCYSLCGVLPTLFKAFELTLKLVDTNHLTVIPTIRPTAIAAKNQPIGHKSVPLTLGLIFNNYYLIFPILVSNGIYFSAKLVSKCYLIDTKLKLDTWWEPWIFKYWDISILKHWNIEIF
jgi:hypothetical protein